MPIVAGHMSGYVYGDLSRINQDYVRDNVLASYRSRYGNPLVMILLSAIASALIKMLIEWLIENWHANRPRLRELR